MPLGFSSEAEQPLGYGTTLDQSTLLAFDVLVTVISQYATSPIIVDIVKRFQDWIDPTADFDQFYNLVWNVDTAQGYGLDVWGRIVGVQRVLHVPLGGFLGFKQDTQAQTFGHGVFYAGSTLTTNYALTDTAYRQLIYAKALANISDGSIPSINRILMLLFSKYGDCYVKDNGDMSLVYVFGSMPSPVDQAIVGQSGVLPKPVGVSTTVSY